MGCDEQLVPLDIHFRVGTRTELDKRVQRAIQLRLPGQNMSDFVKIAVAEWYESKRQRHEEIPEVERVKRELEAKIRRLEEMIRSGAGVVIESAVAGEGEEENGKMDEAKAREAEEKVMALTDVF